MQFCMKCNNRVIRIRRITKMKNVLVGKEKRQKKVTTRKGTVFCINGCDKFWEDERGHTRSYYKRLEQKATNGKDEKLLAEIKKYKKQQFRVSRRPLRARKTRSL